MTEQTLARLDPAALAVEIRVLARDARRLLKAPSPRHLDISDLSRRVSDLQDQIRGRPFHELASWLDNVRRRLETI